MTQADLTCPVPADAPSDWLRAHLALIPRNARVLDLACGRGRHALLLAREGFRVHAIDRDTTALEHVRREAGRDGLAITCEAVDLETEPPPRLELAGFGAVVVFRYLHRPLFPAIREALAPGGCLIYETFTTAQAARGRPRNPAFLLAPGELADLVSPLRIVDRREGLVDGAALASIVATRPR